MTDPFLIVGAGIGGLTAALALDHAGFKVAVHERSETLEEAGAGIQLTPNALHVLFGLGLAPALEKAMVRLEAIVVRNGVTGRLVQKIPVDTCEERWGAPYGVIHRADLQAVLLEAVRERSIALFLGHECTGITETNSGITVRFRGHSHDLSTRLVVGADGLWSTVRQALGRSQPPRFSGKRAWRAVLPMSGVPPLFKGKTTGLWLGERSHLVHYPVRAGQDLNVVAVVDDNDATPGWSAPREASELLPLFAGWHSEVRTLLEGMPRWRSWPLFERPAETSMAKGHIALIGDAAHPMLPFLAQGGACAIEDAAELAGELARPGGDDIPARLAAWSARRLPRVNRIQAEARANAKRYHWRAPLSTARDLGLIALGGRRMLERYAWLYGWTPDKTR